MHTEPRFLRGHLPQRCLFDVHPAHAHSKLGHAPSLVWTSSVSSAFVVCCAMPASCPVQVQTTTCLHRARHNTSGNVAQLQGNALLECQMLENVGATPRPEPHCQPRSRV